MTDIISLELNENEANLLGLELEAFMRENSFKFNGRAKTMRASKLNQKIYEMEKAKGWES